MVGLIVLLFPIALLQLAVAPGPRGAPPPSQPERTASPRAMSDASPPVRIRTDKAGRGLTFDGFVQWRGRYPELVALPPPQAGASPAAYAAQRHAILRDDFADADSDGDGRVSATELADWLVRN